MSVVIAALNFFFCVKTVYMILLQHYLAINNVTVLFVCQSQKVAEENRPLAQLVLEKIQTCSGLPLLIGDRFYNCSYKGILHFI